LDPAFAYLSDYALLAAAAYDERLAGGDFCPSVAVPRSRWKRVSHYSERDLPIATSCGPIKVGRIEYQLWRDTRATNPTRLALAFRGTDLGQAEDWYANFRWVTRLNPFTCDQYAQTRDLVEGLISRIDTEFGPNTEIIAVGHSLGGGLAQQAAY